MNAMSRGLGLTPSNEHTLNIGGISIHQEYSSDTSVSYSSIPGSQAKKQHMRESHCVLHKVDLDNVVKSVAQCVSTSS